MQQPKLESCPTHWSVMQLSCCDGSKSETVLCCSWKGESVLACGLEDGVVKIFSGMTISNENAPNIQTVTTGNEDAISSMDWNVSGSHLAIGSSASELFIWEAESDILHSLLGHSRSISKVEWNHQGAAEWLLTASDDNSVILWNGIERTELQRFNHPNWIWDVHWISSDNLVSCCADKTVKIFQVNVQDPIRCYACVERVYSLRVNRKGDRIATCLENGSTIPVFSLEDDEPITQLIGHKERVFSISWFPLDEMNCEESYILASGSGDGTIRIWDTSSGKCVRVVDQMGTIWEMAFSSNGRFLAASVWLFDLQKEGYHGEITVFATQAWNPVFMYETEYEPDDVCWNADNSQLAISQCPDGKTSVDIIHLESPH